MADKQQFSHKNLSHLHVFSSALKPSFMPSIISIAFPLVFHIWEKNKSYISGAQTLRSSSSAFAFLPFSFSLSSISFTLSLSPLSSALRHLSSPTPPHFSVTDRPILAPTHKMENTHTSCVHPHSHSQTYRMCVQVYTKTQNTYNTHMQSSPSLVGLVMDVCA